MMGRTLRAGGMTCRQPCGDELPIPRTPREEPDTVPSRESSSGRPSIIRDLSRLAVLFLLVAIANLFFLLIALSFIVRGDPVIR